VGSSPIASTNHTSHVNRLRDGGEGRKRDSSAKATRGFWVSGPRPLRRTYDPVLPDRRPVDMSFPAGLERDPMRSLRVATKISFALELVGYVLADVTQWWSRPADPGLTVRTPTRPGTTTTSTMSGRLVEQIVSSRFAEQLPECAAIVNRLGESKRS
jgi:hypothetical protein